MTDAKQMVHLEGGTGDGRLVEADPPPAAHRLYFMQGSDRWSEIYLYTDRRASTDGYGDIPIMIYMETRHSD